jgi:glutamate dehydrogenase
VNSSDLEVNIKIALGPAVARGALPPAERAAFLATLTEGVARRCLAANHGQSLAISLAERQATRGWRDFAALMRHLERRGLLDRALEALPDETTLEARTTAGRPLTRPELAVLTSYAKIALTADLLASTLPDLPLAQPLLAAALPDALSQAYATDVAAHPLRREIIATAATNSLVNRLGASGLVTLAVASGRRTSDVALAAMIMDEACGFGRVWAQIDAQDGRIGGTAQLDLYTRVQAAFLAATRSLATTPAALADPAKAVAMLHAAWQALPAAEAGTGSTTDLSAGVASLIRTDGLWTIATLAADANVPMPTAQAALQQVVIDLRTADLTRRAAMLVAVDPYEARVQADALATLRQIDQAEAARRLRGGVPAHSAALAQVDAVLAESKLSLAGLIVATEALRAAHG